MKYLSPIPIYSFVIWWHISTHQQCLVQWCHGRSPLFFSFRLCH